MSDDRYPVLNVKAESARLGGLSSYGRIPDPETERDARRSLATARLDRELRSMQEMGIRLDPARAAHVVGLLLSTCGVGYNHATLEDVVKTAITTAQDGVRP